MLETTEGSHIAVIKNWNHAMQSHRSVLGSTIRAPPETWFGEIPKRHSAPHVMIAVNFNTYKRPQDADCIIFITEIQYS